MIDKPMEPESINPVNEPTSDGNKLPTPPAGRTDRPTPRRAGVRKPAAAGRPEKARRAMSPAAVDGASVLDPVRDAESLLDDAAANTRALIETTAAIVRADSVDEVVRASLDTIRKAFGWSYGSYWTVDPAENALSFSIDSGRVDDEFQRLTRTARFREGEGLNGRAWRQRDLVFVEELAQLRDCSRAPLATRAGIHSGIALPVLRDGQVIGTMDFFALDAVEVSPTRLEALRTIGLLASDKISKLDKQLELVRIQQMV